MTSIYATKKRMKKYRKCRNAENDFVSFFFFWLSMVGFSRHVFARMKHVDKFVVKNSLKKKFKLLLFFYFLAIVMTGMALQEEFKINKNKNC